MEFDNNFQLGMQQIDNKLEEFICESSGWQMEGIENIYLSISRYQPIRGSSYFPTPTRLANKKTIINVQNSDQNSFLYSVLAKLFLVEKSCKNQKAS